MGGRLVSVPAPSFQHLERLTDAGGLYEHARGTTPRHEHGYCVDDVARGLLVTAREPSPGDAVRALRTQYLTFVLAAQGRDGRFRNRRGTDLVWRDQPSVDDCWGRALWGLGGLVAAAGDPARRVNPPHARAALHAFSCGAEHRSDHPRATAFAALGAADVLRVRPEHTVARSLLSDAAEQVDPACDPTLVRNGWAWPEDRLRYANAALPEVLLAAGSLLERPTLLRRGLDLLDWLVTVQTVDDHLSVVPVSGRGPGETGPGFDQQPIEVAALADACALAHDLTGDRRWARAVLLCVAWFTGHNDARTSLVDPVSGGGCDGLERDGRNENQGAESTLALLSTLQQGRRLDTVVAIPSRPAVVDLTGSTRPAVAL